MLLGRLCANGTPSKQPGAESIQVFLTDINAPCKCRLSINDRDLAVITIIYLVGKDIKMYFIKRMNFNPGLPHTLFGSSLD